MERHLMKNVMRLVVTSSAIAIGTNMMMIFGGFR